MTYHITPRDDDSRDMDWLRYDSITPFILQAILRGDKFDSHFGDVIYVSNQEFGILMRKRDYSSIHLDSSRRVKYVKAYNATVSRIHRLHPDNATLGLETA